MSLRETVNAFGHDVSAHFKRDGYCSFAAAEETEGFIDTSAELDGSRGIAFLCDRIRVDIDGIIRQMNYGDIAGTEVVESFESDFADELLIKGKTVVRVSDFSINKRFLKLLVDTLCLRYGQFSSEERERYRRECRARSSARYAEMDEAVTAAARQAAERSSKRSKHFVSPSVQPARRSRPADSPPSAAERPAPPARTVKASVDPIPIVRDPRPAREPVPEPSSEHVPDMSAAVPPALDIEEPRFSVPEDHVPLEITEEKIEWLSAPKERGEEEISESDLEDMSREETMSYLLASINEINAPSEPNKADGSAEAAEQAAETAAVIPEEEADIPADEPQSEYIPPVIAEVAAVSPENETAEEREPVPEPEARSDNALTSEPPSEDIYIKASRKLREICESGRLTREEIQTALKENLVSAASRFAEITGECEDIPRVIAPKIEELRAASENLERYFAMGEDIAERVMFFMMYQMLSYSDRIIEAPETKERLNYFFKRYGPSGITLSMLDMRVQ